MPRASRYDAPAVSDPSSAVDLTVVAPMFNEAANVERTVGLVRDGLAEFPGTWEFVLVDDGSRDDTRAIAEGFAAEDDRLRVVGYSANRGRGMALRTGFAAARGRVVVSIDFDLSYSIDHAVKLYTALEEHPHWDVVLGSAYMPGGGTEGVDPYRLWVSRTGNRILSLAMDGRFSTITCVLRGYRREVLETLALESERKEIHLEILSKVLALGYVVGEVPAVLRARKKGKSKHKIGGTAISHLLFAFSQRPMLVFGGLGGVAVALGVLLGAVGTVFSFAGRSTTDGPLWSIVVLLIIGGLLLVCFGFIALLIGALRGDHVRTQRMLLQLQSRHGPAERESE